MTTPTPAPPTARDFLRDRLDGLVVLGTVLALAATVAGFAAATWWPFELSSHFRVQYAMSLGAAALILPLLRRRRLALAALAGALLNGAVIAPMYRATPSVAAAAESPIPCRVMLINVTPRTRATISCSMRCAMRIRTCSSCSRSTRNGHAAWRHWTKCYQPSCRSAR